VAPTEALSPREENVLIPGELIPLAAIAVGGIAVIGRVIIQPIAQAVLRMSEQRRALPTDLSRLEDRVNALEEQNQRLERSLDRVLQDRDFYLQLQQKKPGGGLPPPA